MLQLLVVLLCAVLMLLAVLAAKGRQARETTPWWGMRERLRIPSRVMRTLRRTAAMVEAGDALKISKLLRHLREDMHRTPPLPMGEQGVPRVMMLARLLESTEPDALLEALHSLSLAATPMETAAFPVCVQAVLVERLAASLQRLRETPSLQLELADEIRSILHDVQRLQAIDWLSAAESADAVHHALWEDKAYRHLDAPSRLLVRQRVEQVSRAVRMEPTEVLYTAGQLAEDGEPQSIETSLIYWFLQGNGLLMLHRKLRTRRGWLRLQILAHPAWLRYSALWGWGIMTGLLFLNAWQPVAMLPFFLLLSGAIIREGIRRFAPPALPRLKKLPSRLRVLVLLPVTLDGPHHAVRMVRRMKTVRHALGIQADVLLMSDNGDPQSLDAALSAVHALEDWAMLLHRAQPRGSSQGAVETVCRLISENNCEDLLTCATFNPSQLYRAYDLVLVVPQEERLAPGMLRSLMTTLCHPLNAQFGMNAVAPAEGGVRLIRPGAYAASTYARIFPGEEAQEAIDALIHCEELPDLPGTPYAAALLADELLEQFNRARALWRSARWQLPVVETPEGYVRNPLNFRGKLRLREGIRHALLPIAQAVMLLWSLFSSSWALMAFALFAPEIRFLLHPSRAVWRKLCCRIALLPTRAVLAGLAVFEGIVRQRSSFRLVTLETWAQGVGAALVIGLGLMHLPMTVPALLLGSGFAAFPWVHSWHDLSLQPRKPLNEEQKRFLQEALGCTWHYFQAHVTADTAALPPEIVQLQPPLGSSDVTSPSAVAGYLLASVCAREAGLISTVEAAERLQFAARSIPKDGLYHRWNLADGTPTDVRINSREVGLLACASMAAAQAIRTWLPELPPELADVSAELADLVTDETVLSLYDEQNGLFYAEISEDGSPEGHIRCFADEGILLSVAALARGLLPETHIARLDKTRIRVGAWNLPLTEQATASAVLLRNLFFPMEHTETGFIALMKQRGRGQLFGRTGCLSATLDTTLHCTEKVCGIQESSLAPLSDAPLFSPCAAALCLEEGVRALQAFRESGCFGKFGFPDAIDYATSEAVGAYSSCHQGIMMAALAHLLLGAPIRQYFCDLPEVEALLPLLSTASTLRPLRALRFGPRKESAPLLTEREVSRTSPPEQLLLGDAQHRLRIGADGLAHLGDVGTVRLFLADLQSSVRIGESAEVRFAAGEARFLQHFGDIRCETAMTLDAAQGRLLQAVTLTNLGASSICAVVSSLLLPELGAPGTVEVQRCSGGLSARERANGRSAAHQVSTPKELVAAAVYTDAEAFIGRCGTAEQPAMISLPLADVMRPAINACLALRVRLALSGRGQATVVFTTGAEPCEIPAATEVPGIARICAMQQLAMAREAGLTASTALTASRIAGLLGTPLRLEASSEAECAGMERWFALHGTSLLWEVNDSPDAAPLLTQLEGLYTPWQPVALTPTPVPGELPEDLREGEAAFHPGQTLPMPRTNIHMNDQIRETVDDVGAGMEDIRIRLDDGSVCTPWSTTLPRTLHMGPGITTWKAFAQGVTISLQAAALPKEAAFLRILRLKCTQETFVQVGHLPEIRITPDAGGRAELVWTKDAAGQLAFAEEANAKRIWGVQDLWAERLGVLVIDTGDAAFDRLFSRLVLQVWCSLAPSSAAAMAYLDPAEAVRRLENTQHCAVFPLWLVWRRLGNSPIITRHWERCVQAIQTAGNVHELPDGVLFPLAAEVRWLLEIHEDDALSGWLEAARAEADVRWDGHRYGREMLQTAVQVWASCAFGPEEKTRAALQYAWGELYDPENGLLRDSLPTDAPPLSGLPENGGMTLNTAAFALMALLQEGLSEEAYTLLRQICQVEDWLPGGLCASPMARRGLPIGGDEAAGFLLAVLIRAILGVDLVDGALRLHPHPLPEWERMHITLRISRGTWRILCERRTSQWEADGTEVRESVFPLERGRKTHQITGPMA